MNAIEKTIDHTLLKPEATKEQVKQLCEEAKKYKFMAVCVQPYWIRSVSKWLEGSSVKIATVVGFPLGANTTATKVFEAKEAVEHGAHEIDMVINIGALKDKDDKVVLEDIKGVVDAVNDRAIVKVIIETSLLTDEEKVRACHISVQAGAHFVKTSTGFSTGGATLEDVKLMKDTVGDKAKVKASGGVRDKETALKMIEAGAERIGTSSGISIVN